MFIDTRLPDTKVKTDLSENTSNGYIEMDIGSFDNDTIFSKIQEIDDSSEENFWLNRRKSNWFCNKGLSNPVSQSALSAEVQSLSYSNNEKMYCSEEKEEKIIIQDIKIIKPIEDSTGNENAEKAINKYFFRNKSEEYNTSSKNILEDQIDFIPPTPEDPFHASSSEDTLFYPSSDYDLSDDENTTPKKLKKPDKKNNVQSNLRQNSEVGTTVQEPNQSNDKNPTLEKNNKPSKGKKILSNLSITNNAYVDTILEEPHTAEVKNDNLNLPSISNCTEVVATKTPYKRKPDHCYYCETKVLNFGRHIIRHHSMEINVAEILAKPINSRERKELFNTLRRKGNFLADNGSCFKPVREGIQGREKLPCPNCLGHFSSKLLYRHKKKCIVANGNPAGKHFNMFGNFKLDKRLKEEVFPRMRGDKISLEAQKDHLICEFGSRYLKTHREKHFIYVTSRKMRELAKVLLEMRKLNPSITTFISALRPKYFDMFVQATKIIAKYDAEQDVYMSPTFAMNIVTSLKQCCDISITFIYTKNIPSSLSTAEIEADLKTLIRLFESNWNFEISSQAANNLNLKKWNKVTIVPLASDLRLLRQYLIDIARESLELLKKHDQGIDDQVTLKDPKMIEAFNNLIESIYCRVILLNRKRSGELQRMYLHTYLNVPSEIQKYEEFGSVVSLPEKLLLKSLKRVVIRGKRDKGVPVLFHSDVQEHIKMIVKIRDSFIPKNNPYLFALANSGTHLIGYKVLSKHSKLCGAQNPSSITSVRLRKHLATLSQLFNLSDGEIEQLATFMGHTPGVHRSSYRLPDDVYQTAKISKLLLVMEKGGADQYKGKSIDDIEIDMEENLLDDKDDNSDEGEDDIFHELQNITEPSSSNYESLRPTNKTTEERTAKSKKKISRKLMPWTDQQKVVTLEYFKDHIIHKKPPKRHECEELKENYKELLKNKDWLKMKVFVQNAYTRTKDKQ